ncbi:hypothetical protein BDV11DRAFT_32375 [Aspergillus similis]
MTDRLTSQPTEYLSTKLVELHNSSSVDNTTCLSFLQSPQSAREVTLRTLHNLVGDGWAEGSSVVVAVLGVQLWPVGSDSHLACFGLGEYRQPAFNSASFFIPPRAPLSALLSHFLFVPSSFLFLGPYAGNPSLLPGLTCPVIISLPISQSIVLWLPARPLIGSQFYSFRIE